MNYVKEASSSSSSGKVSIISISLMVSFKCLTLTGAWSHACREKPVSGMLTCASCWKRKSHARLVKCMDGKSYVPQEVFPSLPYAQGDIKFIYIYKTAYSKKGRKMAQGQGDGSVGRGLEFDPSVCKNQCPIGIPVVELQEMGTGAHWPGSLAKSRSFKPSGKPLCQKLRWRTIKT